MSHPTEPQVRAPLQERSRRTLARVLAAGWSLLESEGPDGLTVAAITSRARTSVGSFYARFRGKEDLLRYMAEQALEEAAAVWEGLRAELPDPAWTANRNGGTPSSSELRGALDRAVSGLAGLYLDGAAGRVVQLDGIEDPSPSRRRRLEDRLAGDLAVHLGGGARAELAVRILAGTLHDAASRAGEASPYPPGDILITELVELLNGYLGGVVRAPGRPAALHESLAAAGTGAERLVPPLPAKPSGEGTREPGREHDTAPAIEPASREDTGAVAEPAAEPLGQPLAEPAAEPNIAAGAAADSDETSEPDESIDPFDVWG